MTTDLDEPQTTLDPHQPLPVPLCACARGCVWYGHRARYSFRCGPCNDAAKIAAHRRFTVRKARKVEP